MGLKVTGIGSYTSLNPRPSGLCIPMEGLVRDDHMG